MGRLIEGVWDCKYCDTKKIRGAIRVCPCCGRQRDIDIKFYMDNPQNYVNEDVAKTINRNPDWLCSYCDGLNSDDVQVCPTCGASREESKKNYLEHRAEIEARREKKEQEKTEYFEVSQRESEWEKVYESDTATIEFSQNKSNFRTNYNHTIEQNSVRYEDENCDKPQSPLRGWPWGKIFKIGAGVLATILLVFGLIWMFTPKVQNVVVQDFFWERSINIEEYVTVERSDWSLPPDGRLLHKEYEIKTYVSVIDHYETKTRTYTEQVLDHYEEYVSGYRDLGNGYFEEIISNRPVYRTETRTETYEEPVYRQDPVYAWKYYYEIDVWQHAFYVKSSGNDKEPYWEQITLKELQRENGRTETYTIRVINEDGKDKTYSFNYEVWKSLKIGDKIQIKTTLWGTAELIANNVVISTDD